MPIKLYIETNEGDTYTVEHYAVPRVGESLVIHKQGFTVIRVIHNIHDCYTLGSIIIRAKRNED